MKLESILDKLNSFEKNSFLNIIDDIRKNPKNVGKVDKILDAETNPDLKNVDSINIARVFDLLQDDFAEYVSKEFVKTTSQLDILTDILIRDGNCIMKQDWFSRLYDRELKKIETKKKVLEKSFENDKSNVEEQRQRDYKIYKECLQTAYLNDDKKQFDRKITEDELSILLTLSSQLELSQEEIKLINFMIIPIEKQPVTDVINDLKNVGVLFYSRKHNTVYVADEVVGVLRKVRGKEVADKFFRRVLRLFREPQINLICKKHNIDWRQPNAQKIKEIINEGISFSGVLINDIYKDDIKVTEKKRAINDLCDKGLGISPALKGASLQDKIGNLIKFFEDVEKDEKVGISIDGYEKLILDMSGTLPKLNLQIKEEFELQPENVLSGALLLDYNIKPRDVLEIISTNDLESFCKKEKIKTRGNLIANILNAYKDSENLYFENYENIGFRNLTVLKENDIRLKEGELGIKFENITKSIFSKLGFNVDENLRKKLNTKKDKIDILLNLGNNDLILVECKTVKESGYNKFSSVSRQLKAYANLAKSHEFKIVKSLLVAPEFSDDFVSDTELETELNLSLITASSLIKILMGFKKSKRKGFPHVLLMRDVLIQEDRVLKAIKK